MFDVEMNMDGFDEVRDKLDKLKRNEVPLNELFPTSFMSKHTHFDSIEEMFEESEFEVETEEEAAEIIGTEEWDEFINNSTRFGGWESMLKKASQKWMADQF